MTSVFIGGSRGADPTRLDLIAIAHTLRHEIGRGIEASKLAADRTKRR